MATGDARSAHETILRTDEPVGAGLATWLGTVLFVGVVYLTGLSEIAMGADTFKYLNGDGATFTFVFIVACLYATSILFSWGVVHSFDLPRQLRSAAERTGALVPELVLLVAVLIAGVTVALTRSLLFAPLVLALAVPSVFTFFRETAVRPVVVLPQAGAPGGAHYWMESELPTIDPDVPLPPGYELRQLDWCFNQSLSERPRFEHELVYSLRTIEETGVLLAQSRRTGVALHRYLATAGVTQEVVGVALRLRAISSERGYGVLDEVASCVAFVEQLVTVVKPGEPAEPVEFPEDNQPPDGLVEATWGGAPAVTARIPSVEPLLQTPIATLVSGSGSLESVSTLLASLFLSLGHDVIVAETEDGFSLGVGGATGMPGPYLTHEGRSFYFVGQDGDDGWVIGDLPAERAAAITGTKALSASLDG